MLASAALQSKKKIAPGCKIAAMFASVIGILFPVFAMLALGVFLKKSRLLSDAFAKDLNALMFHGALPCMLVDSISCAEPAGGARETALALALATLATFAAAWIFAVPCGISRAARPTFCQTAFRSNNAYVGIPVLALALSGRPGGEAGLAVATLALAPCILLYNVLGVLVLVRPSAGGSALRRSVRSAAALLRNPLILACIAGMALLGLRISAGVALPSPVAETIRLFGKMATPGSLIALGASIDAARIRGAFHGACVTAAFKLALCPLFGAAVCAALGLDPMQRFIVVTYLCCPSAVASFVMAEAMGGDSGLAGASVAFTTILSAVSLSLGILLFLP